MRRFRYGTSDYGGFRNPLTPRIQPPGVPLIPRSFGDLPTGLAPPDIVPRKPTPLIDEIVPNALEVAREAINKAKAGGSTDYESLAAIIRTAVAESLNDAWDHMRYPDFNSFAFTIPAATDITILERAPTKRVYLIVLNTGVANPFQIAWGRTANATDFNIPAGGGGFEWLFVIPQNPVHVFSAVGTTGVCVFAELPLPANQLIER